MERYELTELQHSDDRSFPLRLYIYERNGMHRGGQWFGPTEDIPMDLARLDAEDAILEGREVRITNGGDFLVFHAKDGKVLYPAEGAEAFWKSLG